MKENEEAHEVSKPNNSILQEAFHRRKFIAGASAALTGIALGSRPVAGQDIQKVTDAQHGESATDPGPENKLLREASPNSFLPPPTDHGEVETFWNSFSVQHRRVQPGGWSRQVTVEDFPISKDIAGVNMRLTAGGPRSGEAGRCEPLTVRDEFSRHVLELRAMDNARSQTVREAFARIFERHGLPEAIRSDNGAPFASVQALHGLSRLSAWWVALGIDLERGRPAHPQDSGGHERLHRDIAEELESLGQGATPGALELWREEFNRERPHEALGMRCPAELYRDSSRRYRAAEVQLSYPGMATRLGTKTVG